MLNTQLLLLCLRWLFQWFSPHAVKGDRAGERSRLPLRVSSNAGHFYSHPSGWNMVVWIYSAAKEAGWHVPRLNSGFLLSNEGAWKSVNK